MMADDDSQYKVRPPRVNQRQPSGLMDVADDPVAQEIEARRQAMLSRAMSDVVPHHVSFSRAMSGVEVKRGLSEPGPDEMAEETHGRKHFRLRGLEEDHEAEAAVKAGEFTYGAKYASKIVLHHGDITKLKIDAIVNAANSTLRGGGGVDGAIHQAAGPELAEAGALLAPCPTGQARITHGFNLPAKHVIHTVGPTNKDEKALASCYRSCLDLLTLNKLSSIAFCCIATGIYGYPNEEAAQVALRTVREWLYKNEKKAQSIEAIVFVTFTQQDHDIYTFYLPYYFPGWEEAVADA